MMKLVKLSELFEIKYGVNLEFQNMKQDNNGIPFVSRTAENNGVSDFVNKIDDIQPNPANTISVACGGSVMESFLQKQEYYSGRDLFYLKPKINLTESEMLFYCACLRANKYRYSYGRQANKTLSDILIPDKNSIPSFVYKAKITKPSNVSLIKTKLPLQPQNWKAFKISELFEVKKGKRLTAENIEQGKTPFVSAIDGNNGVSNFISHKPIFEGNTITVNYDGNGVAEAYYHIKPYFALDSVNVLNPAFKLNSYIAMFLNTVIKKEKYRFGYGRKWHKERMEFSQIKLPQTIQGEPDWQFMENYIKSLPYSNSL